MSSNNKSPPPPDLTPTNKDEGPSFPNVTVGPRPGEDPPEPQAHVSEETKKNVEFNIGLCRASFLIMLFGMGAINSYEGVYLSLCGFSNAAVGWLMATEPIATLVLIQSLTYLIDKYHVGRLSLTIATLTSGVALLLSLYLSHIPYSEPATLSTKARGNQTTTSSNSSDSSDVTPANMSKIVTMVGAPVTTMTNATTTASATTTTSFTGSNVDILKAISMTAAGALAGNGGILGTSTKTTDLAAAAAADPASVGSSTAANTANNAANSANNAAQTAANTASQVSSTISKAPAAVTSTATSAPAAAAAAAANTTAAPSSETPSERDPPNKGALGFVVVVMILFKMPLICFLDHESMSVLPPTEKVRYGSIRAFAGFGWGTGTAFFGFLQMWAGYGPCFTVYLILMIITCLLMKLMRHVDLDEYDVSIASFSASSESFSISASPTDGAGSRGEEGTSASAVNDYATETERRHVHHHHTHHPHHHEHPPDETGTELNVMAEPVHFVYTRHQYDDEIAAENAAEQSGGDGQPPPVPGTKEKKAPPKFREVVKMIFVEKSMRRLAVHMFFLIIIGMGFAINQSFLFIYLQEDLDASQACLGLSTLVTVIIEIPILLHSHVIHAHFNDQVMFTLSMFSWFIRGFGYSFLTNPWYVLFLEPLHGITFSFTWLSAVHAVNEHFTEELAASAFGLVHVCFAGAGPLIGLIIGGYLYDALGPRWFYRAAAIVLLISCFAFNILDRWAKKVEEKANAGKPPPTEEEMQRKKNAVSVH